MVPLAAFLLATAGVEVYKGIPYAAPPVGALRWREPQPAAPWKGVPAATAFGPACFQDPKQPVAGTAIEQVSEDCLYLNVWTPKQRAGKLPVMVWLHGGGHVQGAGSLPSYDGAELARRGVVVVTINYRLGPFGYMAHPALSRESPRKVSGNYGTLDQIAALEWVRRNIAAFGGDPARVTLFGESAGSVSALTLAAVPAAKGLFQRVIAESGVPIAIRQSLVEAERAGEAIAAKLGCQDADCLRAKSAAEVHAAARPVVMGRGAGGNRFGPIVDGRSIPQPPAHRLADVDLLIGSNADEGTIFAPGLGIGSLAEFRRRARLLFGARTDEVLALYPARDDSDVLDAVSRWWGDFSFTCPARAAARDASARGIRTWAYYFTHVTAARRLGAFHGSEIPFVFGTLGQRRDPTPAERRLSDAMLSAWVRFAATGDPNGEGLPAWPRYDTRRDTVMEFGDEIRLRSGVRAEACALFDRIAAAR
jgi:para-nitrobenzyl esterase